MHGLRVISVASVLVAAAVMAPSSLAAVRTTPDKTWQVANGSVMAIAVANGKVYIGGTFTQVVAPRGAKATTRARRHLAAFDQRTGKLLAWNPSTNQAVYALVVRGKTVYAGGAFTRANSRARRHLAAFAATYHGKLRRWHAGADDDVRALIANKKLLFAGGDFHHLAGKYRKRLGAVSLSRGRLAKWGPRADGRVTSLAFSPTGRRIYVGGSFHAIGRHKGAHNLAAVSTATGKVARFRGHPDYVVWSIDTYRQRVFIAGGGEGGHLAAYSTTGRRLWLRMADGDFQTVSVSRGTVFAGGHFDNICKSNSGGGTPWKCSNGIARPKILSVTALHGTLTKWDPQARGGPVGVWVIHAGSRKIEAGGYFTKWGPAGANNQTQQARFAQFSR